MADTSPHPTELQTVTTVAATTTEPEEQSGPRMMQHQESSGGGLAGETAARISHEDRSNHASDKFQKVNKLRRFAWGVFAVIQIAYWVLLAIQLSSTRALLRQIANKNAAESVRFMQFEYEHRVDNIAHLFEDLADGHAEIGQYLAGQSNLSDFVTTLFLESCEGMDVEFAGLLDANLVVRLSSNGALIGSEWDPLGIVSLSLSQGAEVESVADISMSDAESILSLVEGEDDWSLKARQSMLFKNLSYGLVAYSANPVFHAGNVIGVILTADVVTGNLGVIKGSLDRDLYGFEEVYVKGADSKLYPVAHARIKNEFYVDFESRIDSATLESLASQVFDEGAWSYQSVHYGTYTDPADKTLYALAATCAIGAEVGDSLVEDWIPRGLFIRGIDLTTMGENYIRIVIVTLALSGGFVVMDTVRTLMVLRQVIDPLEKLVMYSKMKQFEKYDGILKNIMNNRRMHLLMMVFALGSTGFVVAVVPYNYLSVKNYVYGTNGLGVETKGLEIAFSSKMKHIMVEAKGLAYDGSFRALVGNDLSAKAKVSELLLDRLDEEKFEFAYLISTNGTVLAGSSTVRDGQYFNPMEVVSTAVDANLQIGVTTTISYEEFAKENAPRWIDSEILSEMEKSTLHPDATQSTVVVQFIAAPVHIEGKVETDPCDGIVLIGDIVNGKALRSELIFEAYVDGYSGSFYYDSDKDKFEPLASLLIPYGTKDLKMDVSVDLERQLRAALEKGHQILDQTTIEGDVMKVSITRADASYVHNEGSFELLPQYYPPVFLVRGTSAQNWSKIMNSLLAVLLSALLIVILFQMAGHVVLGRPIQRFVVYMNTEVGWKQAHRSSMISAFPKFGNPAKTKKPNDDASSLNKSTNHASRDAL